MWPIVGGVKDECIQNYTNVRGLWQAQSNMGAKIFQRWRRNMVSLRSVQGGMAMKINRTFCIDAHLVEKLEQRVNKSQTVCDALKQFLNNELVDDEQKVTKNLLEIVDFALFMSQSPVDTAQILTARDNLMAFIQEYFEQND